MDIYKISGHEAPCPDGHGKGDKMTTMFGWVTYETLVSRDRKDRCERCAGTGRFVRGNLNGKPAGPGGECFRCLGKGYQTEEDAKRNVAYDLHAFARVI